ncbi:hypothetical protein B7Z17_01630 [Candidatus Saccharibacteria bacterium 32-49-10]|nr:MAG: hypothetical protein B7Z17_01630 [Candidatus Saccharibacteria bacterium 32-49-10]
MPVVSWLFLGGKCRYCKKPIGWLTFSLEALAGLVAVLLYLFWPYGFSDPLTIALFVVWIVALAPLFILLAYDRRWGYLPDVVMWPLIALGVVIFVLTQLVLQTEPQQSILGLMYSLAPAAGFYGLLYVASRGKWIGLGDVKFGIFMGLVLDWQLCLLAVFLANLLACIAILPAYYRGKLRSDSHVAFGPFLIIATLIAFMWGHQLIDWYLSFSGISL